MLNIFLREKKDGSHRVILNLKFLNETIDKVHFKMGLVKKCDVGSRVWI